VVRILLAAHLLHALADASRQGRALVSGEVELPRPLDVPDQRLEAVGGPVVRHCRLAVSSGPAMLGPPIRRRETPVRRGRGRSGGAPASRGSAPADRRAAGAPHAPRRPCPRAPSSGDRGGARRGSGGGTGPDPACGAPGRRAPRARGARSTT